MIVEDKHIYSNKPDFDIPTGKLLQWIEKSFVETIPVFLHTLLPNLNEIQYAQEFVAELERTLRTMEIPLALDVNILIFILKERINNARLIFIFIR